MISPVIGIFSNILRVLESRCSYRYYCNIPVSADHMAILSLLIFFFYYFFFKHFKWTRFLKLVHNNWLTLLALTDSLQIWQVGEYGEYFYFASAFCLMYILYLVLDWIRYHQIALVALRSKSWCSRSLVLIISLRSCDIQRLFLMCAVYVEILCVIFLIGIKAKYSYCKTFTWPSIKFVPFGW